MTKDLLDKFVAIERATAEANGEFKLFGLVSPAEYSRPWSVVVSAQWEEGETMLDLIEAVAVELQPRISKTDAWYISRKAPYKTTSEFVQMLTEQYPTDGEVLEVPSFRIDGVEYQAYLIASRPAKNHIGLSQPTIR
jgi:hypothetical protein